MNAHVACKISYVYDLTIYAGRQDCKMKENQENQYMLYTQRYITARMSYRIYVNTCELNGKQTWRVLDRNDKNLFLSSVLSSRTRANKSDLVALAFAYAASRHQV